LTESTTEQLAGTIKNARNIMRKDKGLSTDIDRLPLLTWLMFLKFLDDMEEAEESRARLRGEPYRPIIEAPYRWRDWAAQDDGITGPEILAFVGGEGVVLADGSLGPGLLTYLRALEATDREGGRRRTVVATAFAGAENKMKSGYLLRDVVNCVDKLDFRSKNDLFTLGHIYESMLKEMRDAAGENGEFYTPRPVVRLMVQLVDPLLGETVLDPAAGTGGFLVEAFDHLRAQARTVSELRRLQDETLFGAEPKPLPFLLCHMNMLLHGLESPSIDPGNSLRHKLNEIGDRERVDVIITNPPFGGEEERGILANFPANRQTPETALLFLQVIMRRLRRPSSGKAGRAAVVVPNGVLCSQGIAALIRRDLLTNFNLHAVVRLPKGIFEPYADIPTNILFFDSSEPAAEVWFYEHPLPGERAALSAPCYTKTQPLQFDEFAPLVDWWRNRTEGSQAWTVSRETILSQDASLDCRNPRRASVRATPLPSLAEEIEGVHRDLDGLLAGIGAELTALSAEVGLFDLTKVSSMSIEKACNLTTGKSPTMKTLPGEYPFVVMAADRKSADHYQLDKPAVLIPLVSSTGHGHASIHRLHYQDGKYAVANILVALTVKPGVDLLPRYLYYYLTSKKDEKLVKLMSGTANTSLTKQKLMPVVIRFPDRAIQEVVVRRLDALSEGLRQIEIALGLDGCWSSSILDRATACVMPQD